MDGALTERWLLSVALAAVCLLPAPGMAARTVTMGLEDFVKNARASMPTATSGTYASPSDADRMAFAAAAKALVGRNVSKAEAALAAYPGFEVIELHDGAGGPVYDVIAEKVPVTHGWGFLFIAVAPLRPELVLEAPHPLTDVDSELVAAQALHQLRPAALVLAGADRYAAPNLLSDMTHVPVSIFESFHEAVVQSSQSVLQLHGFSAATHVGYPDAVLSSGTPKPTASTESLARRLLAHGLNCQLFDGTNYLPLGAQTNVQGIYLRSTFGDGHFLHLEMAEPLRQVPALTAEVLSALQAEWAPQGCSTSGSGPVFLLVLLLPLLAGRPRCRGRQTVSGCARDG